MKQLQFLLLISGLMGQPAGAETACHSFISGLEEMTDAKKSDFYQLLFAHSPTPSEFLSALTKQYPRLASMFENEAEEDITLRQQAEARLRVVIRDYPHWEHPDKRLDPSMRAVVRLVSVLSNIGLNLEEKTGGSSARFSARVLREILQNLKFSDQQVKMAEFLVSNSVMNRLIGEQVTPSRALSEFAGLARIPNLPFSTTLRCQVILSIAEHLVQPQEETPRFTEKNGRLEPNTESFEEFKRLTDL